MGNSARQRSRRSAVEAPLPYARHKLIPSLSGQTSRSPSLLDHFHNIERGKLSLHSFSSFTHPFFCSSITAAVLLDPRYVPRSSRSFLVLNDPQQVFLAHFKHAKQYQVDKITTMKFTSALSTLFVLLPAAINAIAIPAPLDAAEVQRRDNDVVVSTNSLLSRTDG